MNNNLLCIKIRERLNKRSSSDFDSIEDWQIVEAICKVQLEFARREAVKGEETKQDIESIQVLLKTVPLEGSNEPLYFKGIVPDDFLSYKRIPCKGFTDACGEQSFVTYLVEEANLDMLLKDPLRKPSFDWGETLVTMKSNFLFIHTDGSFLIMKPELVYYRFPLDISIVGTVDPSTGFVSEKEQICEFKKDVVEALIDEAAALLAGDIESFNQAQRNTQNALRNE